MKQISEIIAENLISLRKKHGLTQNDLAEKLKYSDNTISRWEHAEITPSIETLEKIAEIYGVPIESLLKENVSEINRSTQGKDQSAGGDLLQEFRGEHRRAPAEARTRGAQGHSQCARKQGQQY